MIVFNRASSQGSEGLKHKTLRFNEKETRKEKLVNRGIRFSGQVKAVSFIFPIILNWKLSRMSEGLH